PVDAKLSLHGLRPVVTPARAGAAPDGNALLKAVRAKVLAGDHVAQLHFRADAARLSAVAARVAAEETKVFLSAPIELHLHGESVGRLEPVRLARLVHFHQAGSRYVVAFDSGALAAAVAPALARFEQKPVDARVVVDSSGVQITPSRSGLAPDPKANVTAVAAAARATGSRVAAL